MSDVLVIEDDPQIRKFLRISLEANGFAVHESRLGADGIAMAGNLTPDVIILDLGLPDMDGIDAIRHLREWSKTPIVVLSVRSDAQEKVSALDAGANDYVTKPFNITELMARLRVMLRTATSGKESGEPVYRNGKLEVDLVKRLVRRDGAELRLSRKEYDLLRLLVTHVGRVLTHQQILREIWGPAHAEDIHYLRVLVGSLRQKLGDDPARPRFVATEQGVGYRLLEPCR
jgi:two-component system KDP operon response regulator KdpE